MSEARTGSRVLLALPLVLGAVHLAFLGWVVVQRFRYPVELEWMSGGVSDHVERLRAGQPLYVAPTVTFIPYLYPPLHYALSALAASVVPISAATRGISILATLVTGGLVYAITSRLAQSRYWALVAAALFVGAYSVTGFWYDLDRSDTLATALLAFAFWIGLRSSSRGAALACGAILGLAFFAKQPALVYLASVLVALVVARRFDLAVATGAGALAIMIPVITAFQVTSGGWFWFYVVKMPASHGVDPKLFTVFFVLDAAKLFAIFAAASAVLILTLRALLRAAKVRFATETAPREEALFAAFVLASFFTSATSRLHAGGFVNVLVFLTTFGAIAFAVIAARLIHAERSPVLERVFVIAASLQLVHYLYDPSDAAPNEGRVRDAAIVESRIRELERKGEVIVHGRGHLTNPRHFHVMALMDVLRAGIPFPEDLRRGLEERRYAAYVIDELGELGLEGILGKRSELYGLITRNYFVAQKLDDREPPPIVGWIAHPSWVFRPRTKPLSGFTMQQLERRLTIEIGLAEMRMRAVQAGARKVDDGDEVEAEAEEIDLSAPAPPTEAVQ